MTAFIHANPRLRWALATLWILSFLVALVSVRFAFVAIETIPPFMVHHLEIRPIVFYGHVAAASVALALLALQFSPRLRMARPALHRWFGRLYVGCVALGGVSGVWLGATTSAGVVAGAGFVILGLLWLWTTAKAVGFARVRDFARHRAWMIRSASLTLAAVTLRIYLPLLSVMLGLETGYVLVAWLCWVPNILLAEWVLRREPRRRDVSA